MTLPRLLFQAGLLAAALGGATVALADDIDCTSTVSNQVIDGNVNVTASCTLNDVDVKGNVRLFGGAILVTRNNTVIDGNVQTENDEPFSVDIDQTTVKGSIQLTRLVGDGSIIQRSTIDGNIQLEDNASRIDVQNNNVGADVQAFQNKALIVITRNNIDGNLQCRENDPPPAGGENVVLGNSEDQCVNLQPPADNGGSNGGNTAPPIDLGGDDGGAGSLGPLSGLLLASFLPLMRRRRRRRP